MLQPQPLLNCADPTLLTATGAPACSVYELYCDYVLKNPFHEMDQVRGCCCAGRQAALGLFFNRMLKLPPACTPAGSEE